MSRSPKLCRQGQIGDVMSLHGPGPEAERAG
jgi:hypothetical protein